MNKISRGMAALLAMAVIVAVWAVIVGCAAVMAAVQIFRNNGSVCVAVVAVVLFVLCVIGDKK